MSINIYNNTEVEILATVKCLTRNVFTFYGGKWHRYAYKAEPSNNGIYLNNRGRQPLQCSFVPMIMKFVMFPNKKLVMFQIIFVIIVVVI